MKHEDVTALRENIALYLNRGHSPQQIADELNCSRTTVYRILRLLRTPEATLADARMTNQGRPIVYTDEIWRIVLEARKADPHLGPIMLHHLLRRKATEMGFDPGDIPGPSAIAVAIREAGLAHKPVGPKDRRVFPTERATAPGVLTVDSWGPWHCRGARLYCITVQDRFTRLAIAVPLVGRRADVERGTLRPTVLSWARAIVLGRELLLPPDRKATAIYADNGLGLAPSNNALPRAARAALTVAGRLIFIPPAQPWRNGRLERFHWSMEREYFRAELPRGHVETIEGLTKWLNYYNVDRPHAGIDYQTPAELGPWYAPLSGAWYERECPRYDEPTPGIVEAVRIVNNDGHIDLWHDQSVRISEVLAGQYVRVRFEVTGRMGIGQIVYNRKRGEDIVVANFSHCLDALPGKMMRLITDVAPVDFAIENVHDNQRLDEEQLSNQVARISRKGERRERKGDAADA